MNIFFVIEMNYQIIILSILPFFVDRSHGNPPVELGLKIVGGDEVEIEVAPWQVSLLNKHYRDIGCGGSIIHPKFVLTAGLNI